LGLLICGGVAGGNETGSVLDCSCVAVIPRLGCIICMLDEDDHSAAVVVSWRAGIVGVRRWKMGHASERLLGL
jgi:hypothetical protein